MNVFSNLTWNDEDECWTGSVVFAGETLETLIDFDIHQPNDSERDAAVSAAKSLLSRLSPEWELKCRRSAAEEITQACYSQSDHVVTESDIRQLLDDMKLEALEFSYRPDNDKTVGIFGYRAAACFPDMNIQLNFLEDLSIDEVMVNE